MTYTETTSREDALLYTERRILDVGVAYLKAYSEVLDAHGELVATQRCGSARSVVMEANNCLEQAGEVTLQITRDLQDALARVRAARQGPRATRTRKGA